MSPAFGIYLLIHRSLPSRSAKIDASSFLGHNNDYLLRGTVCLPHVTFVSPPPRLANHPGSSAFSEPKVEGTLKVPTRLVFPPQVTYNPQLARPATRICAFDMNSNRDATHTGMDGVQRPREEFQTRSSTFSLPTTSWRPSKTIALARPLPHPDTLNSSTARASLWTRTAGTMCNARNPSAGTSSL